ncbi:MAG: DinB family protein [Lewinella sp.]|nr:DinB family protein [Lewinella sp.]
MQYKIEDGFPYYIELAGDSDYVQLFKAKAYQTVLADLTEAQSTYRYASGKWSIKQVIGHMTDHERILIYRALRFSRNDHTPLPGYDQDVLVDHSRFDDIPLTELLEDLENVRNASLSFIRLLSPEQLQRYGQADKYEFTVADYLRATIGHEIHHLEVLKLKYLR